MMNNRVLIQALDMNNLKIILLKVQVRLILMMNNIIEFSIERSTIKVFQDA
jgi:hypothetical protein